QPGLGVGERCSRAPTRARAPCGPARRVATRRTGRALRPRARVAQPRPGVHARGGRRLRERDGATVGGGLPLRLEPALAPGLPARGARRRLVRAAPAAHAPGDLGPPGLDDARDDAGDARRRARTAARAARSRPNRPLVSPDPITVLVSACGAPGTAALMRALRENGERDVRIVGTDMGDLAIGRHLADAFHRVPAGSDPTFADAMLEVCRTEDVDAVLPQS